MVGYYHKSSPGIFASCSSLGNSLSYQYLRFTRSPRQMQSKPGVLRDAIGTPENDNSGTDHPLNIQDWGDICGDNPDWLFRSRQRVLSLVAEDYSGGPGTVKLAGGINNPENIFP